jgi:uncharacterized RDD family membrane protein YckC
VDLDETFVIATPEGLEFEVLLAGLGSRFIAGLADLVIQGILAVILVLVSVAIGGFLIAVEAIGLFVILLLYPILFEVLGHGRTPGKRLSHLRVLRDDGSPVDLQASAIRNLMRLIDGLPLSYLPTVVSIAVTARNQRPGDLAAGTVVVREPRVAKPSGRQTRPPAAVERGLETSAVTPQELAAVRHFLARRDSMDPGPRRELSRRLAAGLRDKVGSMPTDLAPEALLEGISESRSNQAR